MSLLLGLVDSGTGPEIPGVSCVSRGGYGVGGEFLLVTVVTYSYVG